jgi:hypothetical protein
VVGGIERVGGLGVKISVVFGGRKGSGKEWMEMDLMRNLGWVCGFGRKKLEGKEREG